MYYTIFYFVYIESFNINRLTSNRLHRIVYIESLSNTNKKS